MLFGAAGGHSFRFAQVACRTMPSDKLRYQQIGRMPINLLSLAFTDPALEDAFSLYWADSKRAAMDKYGLYASVLQLLPGTIVVVSRGLSTCNLLISLSWMIHLAHGMLLAVPQYYQRRRTNLVACLLLVARVLTAMQIPHCDADSTATTKCLYKTGIIPLLWYTLIFPLPFRYQAPAQLLGVLLYQFKTAVPGCHGIINSAGILPALYAFWNTAWSALSFQLMLQGYSAGAVGAGISSSSRSLDPLQVCWRSVALIQMLLGFILPFPVWYMLELRQRRKFYKQNMSQHERQSSSILAHDKWDDVFHVPVAAVLQVTLTLGAMCLLPLIRYGPYVL